MGSGEIDRIRRVYEDYDRDQSRRARYGPTSVNRAMTAERWKVIRHLLQQAGWTSFAGRRVLEVGCGDGSNLATLTKLGADTARLTGIDLSAHRLSAGRRTHRHVTFALANGASLPFPSSTFDAVLLFTVMSSILDADVAGQVARESQRVLLPGGVVVWYDMRVGNPKNRNVRGISRRQLDSLFPNHRQWRRSLTVLPPLARALGPAAPLLYPVLGAVPPLRSHYAAVLRRSAEG